MAKLPRFTAPATGSAGSGLTRASNISALTNTGAVQTARATQQLGADIRGTAETLARKMELDANLQTDKFTVNAKDVTARQSEDIKKSPILSEDDRQRIAAGYEKDFNDFYNDQLKSVSPLAKQRLEALRPDLTKAHRNHIGRATGVEWAKYQWEEREDIIDAQVAEGDEEGARGTLKEAQNAGLINNDTAIKKEDEIEKGIKVAVVDNIKPFLITAVEAADKEAALDVLDRSLAQLTKAGILTADEGAQADKTLGDWLDSFVSGRIKQEKTTAQAINRSEYQRLSVPIVEGQLTFDDIDQSQLLKADREKWQKYITGSYKDAPTENTPKGHDISFNAVYDMATLQLSPVEAYDVLLEARFVDQSITDDQFNWGVDRIENPYPRDTMENINTTVQSNLGDFNRFFSLDKQRNKTVNESLITWVDAQIKDGKTPTRKEMYAMSSQFRVGDDRWYDIGQIVERGGKDWEVVGFDKDGEPLVEEVD